MNNTDPTEQTSALPNRGQGKTVLIVDDDQGILLMTGAILRASGYNTLIAPSGEKGVELYQEHLNTANPVSLVLLDLTLPGGISGMETLDQLLQIDAAANVIATSGFFEEAAAAGAAQAARQRGFQGILPKPYTSERLLRLLDLSLAGEVAA